MPMSTREALARSCDILALTAAWGTEERGIAIFSDRSFSELENAREVYEALDKSGFSGGNPSRVVLGGTVVSTTPGFLLRDGVTRVFRDADGGGMLDVTSLGLRVFFASAKVARLLAEA